MDIQHIQQEKALVEIIFTRDTMLEQLAEQNVKLSQANEALQKEVTGLKAEKEPGK